MGLISGWRIRIIYWREKHIPGREDAKKMS